MVHDKNIKSKLENRVIQPSSNSWDRLEVMLDTKDKPSKKKNYFKYMAVASLLLLISITFLIKSDYLLEESPNTIVDVDLVNKTFKDSIVAKSQKNTVVSIDKDVKTNLTKKEIMDDVEVEQKNVFAHKVVKVENEYVEKVSSIVKVDTPPVDSALKTTLGSSSNRALVSEEISLDDPLDSEIDMLLAMATQEISNSSAKVDQNKNVISVDADALLADVEQELDLSFKTNVFNKLKQGFQKTKTAVVKRND